MRSDTPLTGNTDPGSSKTSSSTDKYRKLRRFSAKYTNICTPCHLMLILNYYINIVFYMGYQCY